MLKMGADGELVRLGDWDINIIAVGNRCNVNLTVRENNSVSNKDIQAESL